MKKLLLLAACALSLYSLKISADGEILWGAGECIKTRFCEPNFI